MKVEPNIPVKITQAAVKAGDTANDTGKVSMAIGVVTDLGIRESRTCSLAPNSFPQTKMETMPMTVATTTPLTMTARFVFEGSDGYGIEGVPKLL